MPIIRNSTLIKKFVDFFGLKVGDSLDSEAGALLLPVITHPILPLIVTLAPTEAQFAAGIFVPAGKKWRLQLVHLDWTSDVNVGGRVITIRITDGNTGIVLYRLGSRNFQAASLSIDYQFGIGLTHTGSASGLHQTIPLPADLVLLEGTEIVITDEAGIAVGDTVAGGFICVTEEDTLENEVENNRPI